MGVYAPTFGIPIASDPTNMLQAALELPYVDGFFITRTWDDVEHDAGMFTFRAQLEADLEAVADAGKKASIAINAGIHSPPWVCQGQSGAQCLPFISLQAEAPTCNEQLVPVPWDPTFEAEFGQMVQALGFYLADSGFASVVTQVKIEGFNYDTDETNLPQQTVGSTFPFCDAGMACDAGVCPLTNIAQSLVDAGYSDDAGAAAFLTFAGDFRGAFPTTTLDAQIDQLLPSPADEHTGVSMALLLAEALVADLAVYPLMVQDTGLAAVFGTHHLAVGYAHDAGVPVGFQMLCSVFPSGNQGSTNCDVSNRNCEMAAKLLPDGGTGQCDEQVLLDAINGGVDAGATYLEIYKVDLINYRDAGAYAHALLVGP